MLENTISLSKETQIGIPFRKSYWKPTPKFWRITGDILGSLGQLFAIFGFTANYPIFAMIAGVSGWIAKIITNSISYKN